MNEMTFVWTVGYSTTGGRLTTPTRAASAGFRGPAGPGNVTVTTPTNLIGVLAGDGSSVYAVALGTTLQVLRVNAAGTALEFGAGGGGGSWGSITGTLSDQTDLATALAGKAGLAAANTFTVGGQLIQTGAAGTVGLAVQAAASQTAAIQTWQDDTGAAVLSVVPHTFDWGSGNILGTEIRFRQRPDTLNPGFIRQWFNRGLQITPGGAFNELSLGTAQIRTSGGIMLSDTGNSSAFRAGTAGAGIYRGNTGELAYIAISDQTGGGGTNGWKIAAMNASAAAVLCAFFETTYIRFMQRLEFVGDSSSQPRRQAGVTPGWDVSTDAVRQGTLSLSVTGIASAIETHQTGIQITATASGVTSLGFYGGAAAAKPADLSGLATLGLVTAATIPLSGLQQSAATTNQVPAWNGTAWVPVTPAAGGGGNIDGGQADSNYGGITNINGGNA